MNYIDRRWHDLPITIRYIVFISVIITVIIAALSLLFIREAQRTSEIALQNRAEILLDVVASGIQIAEPEFSPQNMGTIADEIGKNENITFLYFYDQNGNVLDGKPSPTDEKIWQAISSDGQDYFERQDNEIQVGRIVYRDGEPIGGVAFGLSTKEFDDRLAQSQRQALIFALVSIPLSIVLVSVLTNQVIHRIEKLTKAVDEVAQGSLSEVSYHSKDELGELSSTFNKMAQALWERDQKLRELNAELESRVESRTAELEELASTLQEANQLLFNAKQAAEKDSQFKSEILATMSHELRTPLNAIIGFTDILLAEIDGEINNTQREDLQRIIVSSEHLLSMIDDTLNIAQIQAGKARLIEDPVVIATVIERIVEPYREKAKAKNISFEVAIDDSLPRHLLIDEKRINHILSNLLKNAIKFTAEGSIAVHVKPHTNKQYWQIIVKDTGIGLAEQYHDVVFEAFRQADNSIRRKYEGIGLGLTIVQHTVNLMNGQVEIDSTEGAGSTFTVILPLKIAEIQKSS